MTIYDPLIQVAKDLITKFGQPIKVRHYTDPTPADPNKPWIVDAATYTDESTVGVILDFRPDQVEGYAYQRGDKIWYVPAKGLQQPITEQDYIVGADGEIWGIISASRVYPSGQDILFELYSRKWPRRSV